PAVHEALLVAVVVGVVEVGGGRCAGHGVCLVNLRWVSSLSRRLAPGRRSGRWLPRPVLHRPPAPWPGRAPVPGRAPGRFPPGARPATGRTRGAARRAPRLA